MEEIERWTKQFELIDCSEEDFSSGFETYRVQLSCKLTELKHTLNDSKEKMKVKGGQLEGGNPIRGRVENDFYATPELATKAIMEAEHFEGTIWEPACGNGAMSKEIMKYSRDIFSSDLVDRGYGFVGLDFLTAKATDTGYEISNVITNPPFRLFQEFAEKALEIADKKVALFGKLQALEGQKRATFLENSPLKTVYVFKKRINPMRNGSPLDENGKPWASTMAFAWYVWEIGYVGDPIIKWI